MKIITLDFETYFDDEYSLNKLTTEAYVRDLRFEAHGFAIRHPNGVWDWAGPEALEMPEWRELIESSAVLCHHAHFDGLILAHHYKLYPRVWLDTLSMARLLLGNHLPMSLAALAEHFQLRPKAIGYLYKGLHWWQLTREQKETQIAGAAHDVDLTFELFLKLAKDFPRQELDVIDATIRMFTEPALRADQELLRDVIQYEQAEKQDRVDALDIDPAELQSATKFVALLEAEGIEVPVKNGKNKPIPAIAKNDQFMEDLQENENPRVQALAEARLGAKSTLNEARARRLLDMSNRGPLCVYYHYCGTHTTAWSGGDKLNFQNFPRLDPERPEKNALRRTLLPPEGCVLIKVDGEQIQCRILNYLAEQWDVIDRFRSGADPYVEIASRAYGFPVTKENPTERGTGKQLELSCGFGAGAATIQRTAALGTYGPKVHIDLQRAEEWRDLYRSTHRQVVQYWYQAERVLEWLAEGRDGQWGIFQIADHCLWLATDVPLIYELERRDDQWYRKTGHGWSKIWGAKLVQNVVHALNRLWLSELLVEVVDAGFKPVMITHDEIVVLTTDDEHATKKLKWLLEAASYTPLWLGDCPLAAEGKILRRYE